MNNYKILCILNNNQASRMKTKDKIIVGFVWGIIVFETTCFLSIMAPLLYQNV